MSDTIKKLGPVARRAYEEAKHIDAETCWEYVASCVVLAFDNEMSARVSRMHRRTTLPIMIGVFGLLVVLAIVAWRIRSGS